MELGLKNRTAFVAASSQGLGKSVATELAREGARVVINGRSEETLNKTREEIQSKFNTQIIAIAGDLSKAEDRDRIVKKILEEFGHIDILVTNTGGPPSGKFEDFDQADWDNAYQLLLGSAVSIMRSFIPGMKEQTWGRIISITSQAVKQPVENLILSNSVRASVAGLTKTLASELGEFNITVNNVMPGYTNTNRLKNLIEKNPDMEKVTKDIPLKRFGEPDEFAAAVTFLASEKASYITGVSLAVDGGWIKSIL